MSNAVLTVYNLSKAYVIYPVFSDVSFTLNAGERAALVGPNGVGKSTVLKIIAGIETPTSGSVVKAKGAKVVYLAQEAASSFASEADLSFPPDSTLHDSMLLGTGLKSLQEQLNALEARMGETQGEEWDRLMREYEQVTHRFELAGGYSMEHQIEAVLQGLGFQSEQFSQPLDTMSGGQRTRAALGRALLADPDILLLDEPTNHLDIEAIEWLENYLIQWKGTLLCIAHDRRFLNKVTTRTLDMEFTQPKTIVTNNGRTSRVLGEQEGFSRLQDYSAAYDKFLELKAERYQRLLAEYEAQNESVKRTEEFIRRYMDSQKTRQAKGRLKRLMRLERLERPPEKAQLRLTLRAHVRAGQSVFEAEDLAIGYMPVDGIGEPKVLARCSELEIERGERVALIGPNGTGKTTLLKTIMGTLPPLAGHLELGHNVKFGYYSQTHEGLNPSNMVIDEVRSVRNMTEETARDLLAKMLFTGDNILKQIGDLSGGERSRVALTKLTLTDANFLILDEPTNHLDLEAQEALTQVLANYGGTILFVSHDRAFIDDIATQVWVLENGTLTSWDGNYTEYMAERARREEQSAGAAAAPMQADSKGASAGSDGRGVNRAAQRQERASQRERDKTGKRLKAAEERVSQLEVRLNSVSDALTDATNRRDLEEIVKLGTEYARLEEQLEEAYQEWQSAEAEVTAGAAT